MNKYQNGKIYKITCVENDLVYYGSTYGTLTKRLSGHKSCYKNYLKGGKARKCRAFDIVKYSSAKIELVEDYQCSTKFELKNRERYYIENNECCNKCTPNKTKQEYMKEYYEKNGKVVKEKNRKYKQLNKEKIKQQQKEYRELNKDKISKKRSVKVKCECGQYVVKCNLARHKRTKKHMNSI